MKIIKPEVRTYCLSRDQALIIILWRPTDLFHSSLITLIDLHIQKCSYWVSRLNVWLTILHRWVVTSVNLYRLIISVFLKKKLKSDYLQLHYKLGFIPSTGPTLKQLKRKLYITHNYTVIEKRYGTPNESAPSREILMWSLQNSRLEKIAVIVSLFLSLQ